MQAKQRQFGISYPGAMPTVPTSSGIAVRMFTMTTIRLTFTRVSGLSCSRACGGWWVIDGWLPPTARRLVMQWTELRREGSHEELGLPPGRMVDWSGLEVLTMIDVVGVNGSAVIRWRSSSLTGRSGARDFSFLLGRAGPMVEPLKGPGLFRPRVRDDGALTWPNGYDWDPIALHAEMDAAGLLHRVAAAK